MNIDLFNGMLQSWDSVHTDVNRMDSFIIANRLTKKEMENYDDKSDVTSTIETEDRGYKS